MSEGRERGPLDFDDDPPAEHVPLTEPPGPGGPRGGEGSRRTSARAAGMQYLWVVGAAAILLVVVLGLATLRHGTERGARGVPDGTIMPPFAAPSAASRLNKDVDLATRPNEGGAGKHPACTLRGPEIVNGCALREAGPVVLAFFTSASEKCVAQIDAMQQVVGQLPGVEFVAIAIRGRHDDLRAMAARHRWSFPIGWDRDGGLSGAYHVQICPQMTFARRGGRVVDTTFGLIKPAELAAKVRRLLPTS
jgi:peroxiredoxin